MTSPWIKGSRRSSIHLAHDGIERAKRHDDVRDVVAWAQVGQELERVHARAADLAAIRNR